jgi:tRNA dimethylallyltransferase
MPDAIPLLVGPTAAGKSTIAQALAERTGATLCSLDSMQVYRGMDVGTAKPASEERARVPHELIDLVEPDERYDVQRYLADAEGAIARLREAGRRFLFVGGTGFYLQAFVRGLFGGPPVDPALRAELVERVRSEGAASVHAELARVDPAAAERIHPNDEKRVLRALEVFRQTKRPISAWQREWGWHGSTAAPRAVRLFGVERPDAELDARIAARTRDMLARGWVEEAVRVRAQPGFGPTSIQALGYREVLRHADGELTKAEVETQIATRTRRFARRQRTWYRKFADTVWLDPVEGAVGELQRALGW